MLSQVAQEALMGEVALVLLGGEGGSSLHKNLRNHWNLHGDAEESDDELRVQGDVVVVDGGFHWCFGTLFWQREELLHRSHPPSQVRPRVFCYGTRSTPLGLKSEKALHND